MRRARNARLDDENDDDMMVPDGGVVRVPVALMDSLQRSIARDAAGYLARHAPMTDEILRLRQKTRDAYVAQLSDAWRSPRSLSATDKLDRDTDPQRDRMLAYDQMVARNCNAWRTPHRDFSQPDVGSRPEDLQRRADPGRTDPDAATAIEGQLESWRGRDIEDLAREVETPRRAAHAEFSRQLSNAWRGGV